MKKTNVLLTYVKSLCGDYVRRELSNMPSVAIRYQVLLSVEGTRHVLVHKTEYGDGHNRVDSLPVESLDEDEEKRVDLTLSVLERLKDDWGFEPEYPAVELGPREVFTFDLGEEIEKFFSDTSIPSGGDKPEFVVLAGGVCSGKSTVRHEQFVNHVHLDAGEIFLNLSRDEYFDFGAMFEEPLEIIGRMIAQRAVNERRNVVTEIIGANAPAIKNLLEAIIATGYEPKFNFVHCDGEVAGRRNLNRGNNISAHYCEPYHLRWLMEALTKNEAAASTSSKSLTTDELFAKHGIPSIDTTAEHAGKSSVHFLNGPSPSSAMPDSSSSPSNRSPAEIAALEQVRKGSEAQIRVVSEQQKTPWTMEEAKEQFRRNGGTSTATTPPPSRNK